MAADDKSEREGRLEGLDVLVARSGQVLQGNGYY